MKTGIGQPAIHQRPQTAALGCHASAGVETMLPAREPLGQRIQQRGAGPNLEGKNLVQREGRRLGGQIGQAGRASQIEQNAIAAAVAEQ